MAKKSPGNALLRREGADAAGSFEFVDIKFRDNGSLS